MTPKPRLKKEPRFELVCEMCGVQFKSHHAHTKTCSVVCRNSRTAKNTGRFSSCVELGISSGTAGAISELMVCSDLMKKGYAVFRSLSPSCFCDAVAIKNETILMVEIRTGYFSKTGNTAFPPQIHTNGKSSPNCYGVYIRTENVVKYFSLKKEQIEL